MSNLSNPISHIWWRFDRYEVRDGYIRPAKGAKIKAYNPWASSLDDSQKLDPEYSSLIDLVDNITSSSANAKRFDSLSKENENNLLAWCAEHGLLGILPHRAIKVTLAAQGSHDGHSVDSSQTRYIRIKGDWQESPYNGNSWVVIDETYIRTDELEIRRELEEHLTETYPPPSVILNNLKEDNTKEERLHETWGSFFPDIPKNEQETYQYPQPLSESFWRIYAEPVDEFIKYAVVLRNALDHLREIKPVEDEHDIFINLATVGVGTDIINSLVSSIGLELYASNDGSYRQRWSTPSLLASYALMIIFDLSGKLRPRRCGACRTFFFTDSYKMLYCSDKCRHTAQKRRYRKKKKDEQTRSTEA